MQEIRLIMLAIVINILLGAFYVFFNYSIYYDINSQVPTVCAFHWTPWTINAPHYDLTINEKLSIVTRVHSYFNYPFWEFFVLILTNLLFISWLATKRLPFKQKVKNC